MTGIMGRLGFEQDGMRGVVPSSPDEIITEGQALHTCVGGYAKRVADRECVILAGMARRRRDRITTYRRQVTSAILRP